MNSPDGHRAYFAKWHRLLPRQEILKPINLNAAKQGSEYSIVNQNELRAALGV